MKEPQVCCGEPMEHRARYYPDSGITQGRVQCAYCGNCFGDAVKIVPGMPGFDIAKERGESQHKVNLLLERISQLKAIGHEVAA